MTAYFRNDVDLWHLGTTKIMHNSFEFATNGGKNLLFHNLGNGKFEDVTDKMGVGSTRWTLAAASADPRGEAARLRRVHARTLAIRRRAVIEHFVGADRTPVPS